MDRTKRHEQRIESFAAPFGYPRVLGAYLAINAVPDTWMLVDSADCATLRAEIIQDNHDWQATLITEDGKYRIAGTGVCPHGIVLDRREMLAEQIEVIAREPGALLFVYPAPITALLGIDYRNIVDSNRERLGMKTVVVDPVDSVGNWVAGYGDMMALLARHIELPSGVRPEAGKVAVVGYMWDRNEADHAASVAELERLLAGIGLECVSVWLSGKPTTDLARVAEAGTLLALPCGGSAAQVLAGRTGARVIDLPLPVGLEATVEWLRRVGEAVDAAPEAERFIEEEARAAYALLSKAVVRHLVERPFVICLEATLGAALCAMVEEMGGEVPLLATTGEKLPAGAVPAARVLENPTVEALRGELKWLSRKLPRMPVLIANERGLTASAGGRYARVPLGFQSGGVHALFDAPFLGFKGTVSLVDRIGNAIALAELSD